MTFLPRRSLLAVVLAVVATSFALAQPTALPVQADRVAAVPDLPATTVLAGHVPAWATSANDAGAVPDALPLRLTFVLARSAERQAAFTHLLADQQDPASAQYYQWLTPRQVGTLYGPTQHDLDALTGWLTAQGFAITEVAPSRVLVTVDAPAATVGNALGTSFRYFAAAANGEGKMRLAAVKEPAIPAAFAPLVQSIAGLADLALQPMHHAESLPMAATQPGYTNSGSGNHYLTPGDFATIFDLKPVYQAGLTGTGQKVAIIGRSRVVTTDITEYEAATGLATNLPNVVIPTNGIDPGVTGTGDQGEATLDVDRVIGTAPGVQADLVVSSSAGGYDGIYVAANYEVQTLLDPVMNISFGSCEPFAGPSGVSLWDTLFAQAASEGISVFVSSADSGAATCDTQFATPPAYQLRAINYICSSSYATCAGATELADTANPSLYWSSTNGTGLVSALSYIPEGAWNDPVTSTGVYVAESGGGGASLYVPKPAWQTGTGVPADNARDVPDVSFPGSSHDGYYACYAIGGGDCANNRFEYFSGTSAAAPGLAAVTALLNQKTGGSQGNLNPLLYRIAASTPNAFHDATPASSGVANCSVSVPSLCNNSTPSPTGLTGGLAGYALTVGYDQATGLGSLDIANFLNAAAVRPTALAATRLAVSENNASINDNQPGGIIAATPTTVIFTAILASSAAATPSGTVQFYANGNALGTPLTVASGRAVTGARSFPVAGSYLISAVYSGDGTFATSTAPGITLTVTGFQAATTLTASVSTIQPSQNVTFSSSVAAVLPTFNNGTTVSTLPVATGLVRFYLSGTTGSGYITSVPLVNGTVSTPAFSLPVGSYSLTAYYLGDGVYTPVRSTTFSFIVQKLTSFTQLNGVTTTIGAGGSNDYGVALSGFYLSPAPGYTPPPPTGTIQLYANGGLLGAPFAVAAFQTVISPDIPFAAAGTYSITAAYSGDANWLPSTSTVSTLTVLATPASYRLSAASPTLSLTAGTNSTDVLTLAAANNFAGTVNLACSVTYNGTATLNYIPTCSFLMNPAAVTLLLPNFPDGVTIATTVPHTVKGGTLPLAEKRGGFWSHASGGMALAALLLWLVPGRGRSRGTLLALLVVAGLLGFSGCGGSSTATTPTPTPTPVGTTPGSYTVTVTATTTAAGIPLPAPVTIALTVN